MPDPTTNGAAATVRAALDAYNAKGVAGLQPYVADDFEWVDPPELPDADAYRGYGGLVEAIGKYLIGLGPFEIDVQYLAEHAGDVIAVVRLRPVGAESLVPRGTTFVQVYRVDGHAITALRSFFDAADVRERLGIPARA